MSVHVFVGPTLAAADIAAATPAAAIHPPVAHGDLLRVAPAPGDVVILVDGYLHQVASVRHKEILWLLAGGVRVVGCASMGALRAAELDRFGMVGHGAVYRLYRDGTVEADDEVVVLHGEAPEYRTFGVPLVNVRHAVRAAREAGVLSSTEADVVVTRARALHYTERTWRAVERAGSPQWTDMVRRLRRYLAAHPDDADVKAADARDTLRRLPELTAAPPTCAVPDAIAPAATAPPAWQNRLLARWRLEFSPARGEPGGSGAGALLRYQQIYRPDFPDRWRRFALAAIAGAGAAADNATAVAARFGLTTAALTPAQRAEWLTAQEEAELTGEPVVARILARSYRPPRGLLDLLTADPDLAADRAARQAVAESALVNAEIAGWAPRQSPDYLRFATLRDHLAVVWRLDGLDDRALTAAARDRGFGSLAEAVEAVRPFFLRHHLAAPTPAAPTTGTG